jgi:hypothetical protein
VEEAVARLRDVRGVALAYGELVVTDPAVTRRGGRPALPDQRYLAPAPDGVDAVAAWGSAAAAVEGVRFVDVEEAWRWTHDDLDALGVTLLCNTQPRRAQRLPGDHATPRWRRRRGGQRRRRGSASRRWLDRVLVASHFKQKGYYVVDALAAVGGGALR